MNTTQKYVYERPEIDPLTYCEPDTAELSLLVTSSNLEPFVMANYTINPSGKLYSCQRNDISWTAFPALSSRINVKDQSTLKDVILTEKLEYEEDKLVRSTLKNSHAEKVLSKTDYIYTEGLLLKIETHREEDAPLTVDEMIYHRDSQGYITSMKKRVTIAPNIITSVETHFTINQDGLIVRKLVMYRTGYSTESEPITEVENLLYNDYHQLISSVKKVVVEGQEHVTKVTFDYHSPDSQRIKTWTKTEDNRSSTTTTYAYDQYHRLLSIQIENEGNVSTTTYLRKQR